MKRPSSQCRLIFYVCATVKLSTIILVLLFTGGDWEHTQADSETRYPSQENWPKFREAVRARALRDVSEMPNFACLQVIRRFLRLLIPMNDLNWEPQGVIFAELTYAHG